MKHQSKLSIIQVPDCRDDFNRTSVAFLSHQSEIGHLGVIFLPLVFSKLFVLFCFPPRIYFVFSSVVCLTTLSLFKNILDLGLEISEAEHYATTPLCVHCSHIIIFIRS